MSSLALRWAKYCGLIVFLALLLPDSALFAQDEAEPMMEEMFITGSRIGRNQFDSASPIDVFDTQDFKRSGATSLDEFLKEIPAFTSFQYGTTTNNGNNGVKMVDLRGCGVKRTLILINGRRQVGSFVGGPDEIGAVDLNTVPMYMVERVEVFKDGASTTYGSDALCGVVNVITRKDTDGGEINFNYGAGTEDWDADNWGLDAQIGTSTDRGWVNVGARYQQQDEIKQSSRAFAQNALWPLMDTTDGTFTAFGLGSSNSQTIRVSDELLTAIGAGGGPDSSNSWRVDAEDGLRPYNASTDFYNYAPVNALVTPNDTWNIAGSGEYKLAENLLGSTLNAYGEVGYTKRKSAQRLAPDASFNTVADFFCDSNLQPGDVVDPTNPSCPAGALRANDWVPSGNPFNPFGVNGATLNPYGVSGFGSRINRRFVESGGRRFTQEVNTLRIVAGFNGEFTNNIGWDVAYIFADNHESQETLFYGRFDRWMTAVDPALCGADSNCADVFSNTGGVFNPYGQFGEITPEQMTYLSVGSLKDITNNRMETISFNLNGDAWELPGGTMGWAAGFERRNEDASYSPDEFSAQGLTTSGANSPLAGGFSVNELYGELRLPLLSGAPLADLLTVDGGVRYSDYDSGVGDTTNFSLGLEWGPLESLRFRGRYSTGFRAPNIVELYGGNQSDFPVVDDPCELWPLRNEQNANVVANCTADGWGVTDPTDLDEVSLNTEYGFQYQSTFTQLAEGQLEPEESDNFTVGAVWIPTTFLSGLQTSLDYWNIQIDGYIDAPAYNALLRSCYEQADRDSAAACTPFTAGYRLDGLAPDGEVPLLNLGKLNTSGIDFEVDYAREVGWGWITNLDLTLSGTYLLERETEFPIYGQKQDKVGTASGDGEVYPEWRWYTWAGVGGESWTFGWKMRYYGEADDLYRPPEITDDAVAEDMLYHDLRLTISLVENIEFNLGIDNLTDEEPPRFHSAFNANTEPGVYDVIGRRIWGRATWAF